MTNWGEGTTPRTGLQQERAALSLPSMEENSNKKTNLDLLSCAALWGWGVDLLWAGISWTERMWECLSSKSQSNPPNVRTRYGLVKTWYLLHRSSFWFWKKRCYEKSDGSTGVFCLEIRLHSPHYFLASGTRAKMRGEKSGRATACLTGQHSTGSRQPQDSCTAGHSGAFCSPAPSFQQIQKVLGSLKHKASAQLPPLRSKATTWLNPSHHHSNKHWNQVAPSPRLFLLSHTGGTYRLDSE